MVHLPRGDVYKPGWMPRQTDESRGKRMDGDAWGPRTGLTSRLQSKRSEAGITLRSAASDRRSSSKWLQKQETSRAHRLQIRSGRLEARIRQYLGDLGPSCFSSLPPAKSASSNTRIPSALRWLVEATWLSASSRNFVGPSSHLLHDSHGPKVGCPLVLNSSQARPPALLPARSSQGQAPNLAAAPP